MESAGAKGCKVASDGDLRNRIIDMAAANDCEVRYFTINFSYRSSTTLPLYFTLLYFTLLFFTFLYFTLLRWLQAALVEYDQVRVP